MLVRYTELVDEVFRLFLQSSRFPEPRVLVPLIPLPAVFYAFFWRWTLRPLVWKVQTSLLSSPSLNSLRAINDRETYSIQIRSQGTIHVNLQKLGARLIISTTTCLRTTPYKLGTTMRELTRSKLGAPHLSTLPGYLGNSAPAKPAHNLAILPPNKYLSAYLGIYPPNPGPLGLTHLSVPCGPPPLLSSTSLSLFIFIEVAFSFTIFNLALAPFFQETPVR